MGATEALNNNTPSAADMLPVAVTVRTIGFVMTGAPTTDKEPVTSTEPVTLTEPVTFKDPVIFKSPPSMNMEPDTLKAPVIHTGISKTAFGSPSVARCTKPLPEVKSDPIFTGGGIATIQLPIADDFISYDKYRDHV